MQILRSLYQRFRQLVHEVAKFGTVGAIAYAVQLGATNLFWYGLGMQELAGQALGVLCATLVAFAGNRFWTFAHRARSGLLREYALFFVFNAVGLLIQMACLGFTVYVLGFDSPLARNISGNVVGVALGSLFRFWSYRKWVFRAPDTESAEESDAEDATGRITKGTTESIAEGTTESPR